MPSFPGFFSSNLAMDRNGRMPPSHIHTHLHGHTAASRTPVGRLIGSAWFTTPPDGVPEGCRVASHHHHHHHHHHRAYYKPRVVNQCRGHRRVFHLPPPLQRTKTLGIRYCIPHSPPGCFLAWPLSVSRRTAPALDGPPMSCRDRHGCCCTATALSASARHCCPHQ